MPRHVTRTRQTTARVVAALATGAVVLGSIIAAPGATAASVGVPAGTLLTVSDSITVTKAGTVIDAKHVKGTINVQADNVTIRNTKVTYGGYHSIRIYDGADGTRIVDSTVECTSSKTNGIVFGGYTAERVALTGCRNDFMLPATVIASSVDGQPFNTAPAPTTSPSPTATTTAPKPTATTTTPPKPTTTTTTQAPQPTATTATPQPTVTTTTPPPATPAPVPSTTTPGPTPIWGQGFPTLETTGPRVPYSSMTKSGGITTSYDGQVIDRMDITGNIRVRHDNVVVRDSRISFTSTYGLNVIKKADGSCPVGTLFEYVEVDGRLAAENDIPVYSPGCGWTVDHAHVHNVGRTSRMTNNNTFSNSYVHSSRTGDSGAHRGAVGTSGGSNNKIINNVLLCEGTGCSAAIPMYGDYAPINGMLVQHNLMATTGGYCAYGGSVSSKAFPLGSNVKFIDNHFSTRYFPTCGRFGTISSFDRNVRGNEWRGNVWHETGKPLL